MTNGAHLCVLGWSLRVCIDVFSFRESGGSSSVADREDEPLVVEEEGVVLPSQSESDELL